MDINVISGINTNSSSVDNREGTDLNTVSDFTKKIILDFINSKLPGNSKRS